MTAPTPVPNIIYVELDVSALGLTGIVGLASAIVQSASTSTFVAGNPALAACAASIKTRCAAVAAADALVIADETKLSTDKQTYVDEVGSLVRSVVQFKAIVETTARTAGEVKSAGLTPRAKTALGLLQMPTGIDIFIPKQGHGKAKVSAQETGTRKRYAAQICVGPTAQDPWMDLPGDAKSHWLTSYPSGTLVWVRYATVRGHEQSDWCAPVAVTIP